jgi:tellurite resistance protein
MEAKSNSAMPIFKPEQLAEADIETLLINNGAKEKPAKAVCLIRESARLPGAITIRYFDQFFIKRIFVLNMNSEKKWIDFTQKLEDLFSQDKTYNFFTSVSYLTTKADGHYDELLNVLSELGFARDGVLMPQ